MSTNINEFGLFDCSGKFYPTEYGKHSELCTKLYRNEYGTIVKNPQYELEKIGWVTFGYSVCEGYYYLTFKRPTQQQIDAILDHAIKYNLINVFNNFYKLWKHDEL
jgi:hypothetical protein